MQFSIGSLYCTRLSSVDLQSSCGARKCVMAALAVWSFPVCVTAKAAALVTPKCCASKLHNSIVGAGLWYMVAALAVWKLSQYLCESCNFSRL